MSKFSDFFSNIYSIEDKIYRRKKNKKAVNLSGLAIVNEYHGIRNRIVVGATNFKDAIRTKLSDVDFENNNKMIMEYDFGSTTTFIITYLESRNMEKYNGNHYPYIIDGAGRGMLDDMCDFELKEVVEDIDKKGYSDHFFTPGYERKIKYDYRYFNIKNNNALLKGEILDIKNGYEVGE